MRHHRLDVAVREIAITAIDVAKRGRLHDHGLDHRHRVEERTLRHEATEIRLRAALPVVPEIMPAVGPTAVAPAVVPIAPAAVAPAAVVPAPTAVAPAAVPTSPATVAPPCWSCLRIALESVIRRSGH